MGMADYEENGVLLYEFVPDYGQPYLVVADEEFRHYRLTFSTRGNGSVSVGVDAEWSDQHPGELANFTFEIYADCYLDDTLLITDAGELSVLARSRAASSVMFRKGFILQLPVTFVPVVRRAIAIARERATDEFL